MSRNPNICYGDLIFLTTKLDSSNKKAFLAAEGNSDKRVKAYAAVIDRIEDEIDVVSCVFEVLPRHRL